MKKVFCIKKGNEYSLEMMQALHKEGHIVIRSGHLGNHYLSNLLIFEAGIPIHIIDGNLFLRDTNYYPSYVFLDNQRLKIGQNQEVLVPFASFVKDLESLGIASILNGSPTPGDLHFQSIKSIFNKKSIWSEAEFMVKNYKIVEELVYWISKFNPNFFTRKATKEGMTFKSKSYPKDIVKAVMGFYEGNFSKLNGSKATEFLAGTIPEIKATIMITTLVGVLTSGKNQVFELSGPDMVNYAFEDVFTESMNELYYFLRDKISKLPEIVELVVVPTFYFRLGSLESEKKEMDKLWDNLKKAHSLRGEKGEAIKKISLTNKYPADVVKGLTDEIIRKFGAKRTDILREIASNKKIFQRMDFSYKDDNGKTRPKDIFFSQYDLISSNERLYIPKEILSLSMNDAKEYYHIIESAIKQYS